MKTTIDGIEYNVIIEKKNNRNTYIRVKEDLNIYVTTNYFVTKHQILKLIEENKTSIKKMIEKQNEKQKRKENFYYFGKIYDIIIVPTLDKIDAVGNIIYVKDEKSLEYFIKKQMKKVFEEHYEYYYEQFEENISKPTLKIRNMKTRWGVCNRKSKTITLNSELIKYPIECLDYVIVHELSHLVHFDHSKEFWKTVEQYYPNYKKYRKILKG